jgi:signal transduction histidine kinase
VKDVLLAILNELLTIVNAEKGIVFSVDNGFSRVEITSDAMTRDQVSSLAIKVKGRADSIQEITSLEDALIFPIKNEAGNYLILICSKVPIIDEEKLNLLKLFIETASEVLLSVNQQEQFLRNEKVATIGQVAAGIIHEINNPLSSLVSLIQPDGLMKKKLSAIDTSAGENEKLVGEIVRYLDIASMAMTTPFSTHQAC